MLKHRKKYLILVAVVAVIGISVFSYFKLKPDKSTLYKLKNGNLEVTVNCKGEIRGEKYVEVNLPELLCNEELRIYQYKLTDVILEGKEVKKGDYIAKLDEGQLSNRLRELMQQKEKFDSDLRNEILDSTVVLSNKRQSILNAKLDIEYERIDLEQSKYESEAYQRKAKMRFQKAEMEITRLTRDYLLARNRQKLQVGRFSDRATELQNQINDLQAALAATRITSPEDGIVMFAKNWNGKTYGKDSEINIWRPLVATLPDMSQVVTETYIREIDIAKISMNDSVRIVIDALPDKVFWGKVIKIATIGEEHKDFDMKVFKVIVRLNHSDKEMKPGMSANNDIIIASYRDKLLVPLKAVFSKKGKEVVYLKDGHHITEQEITMVDRNEEFGFVNGSLKAGDVILLYQPDDFKTAPDPHEGKPAVKD